MSINFPKNPSTDDNYTYLATSWKYNGVAWEKSAATETGNAEGNTGEVAFYPGLGSDIRGATAFFYGGAGIGIGTSGPTELLDVRGGNIKVDGGITAEKLNIGDDGAFFSASITVAEAVKADEILITNNGADTLNRWTNSTGLTVTNGITAGGGIYAAGGVTLGSNVNVGGDLTVGGDIIMTDIETIKIGGDTEHIAFNGAGAEINVRANELSIDHYLQHFGDNNTHLEFQTDQITLSAGGVDAIDIVPTQVHFGVGITADGGIYAAGGITAGGVIYASGGLTSDRLHVSGETVFNGTVTAISAGDVALNLVADSDNSGENDNPIISMGQDGALARFDLGIVGDAGQIFTNSLANAAFLDTANSFNDLQFSVAGAAKMTILDSGNIGIGTNAPTQKLSVIGGGITADNGIYVAGGVTFSNLSVNDNYNFPTSAPSEGNILLVGSDGDLKFEPHTDSTSFVVDSDIPLATGIRYKAIYKVPYSNMVVTRLDLRSDDVSPSGSGDSLQVALKGIQRASMLEAASPTIQATIETVAIPLGGQYHHGTSSITNANIGEDNSVTYLVVDVTGNAGGHSNFCLMVWLGVRS